MRVIFRCALGTGVSSSGAAEAYDWGRVKEEGYISGRE